MLAFPAGRRQSAGCSLRYLLPAASCVPSRLDCFLPLSSMVDVNRRQIWMNRAGHAFPTAASSCMIAPKATCFTLGALASLLLVSAARAGEPARDPTANDERRAFDIAAAELRPHV